MKASERTSELFWITVVRTTIQALLLALIFNYHLIFISEWTHKGYIYFLNVITFFCYLFGGHWPELWFINYLKFRLPHRVLVLYPVRILFWYAIGVILTFLSRFVVILISGSDHGIGRWWEYAAIYVIIELIMHMFLQLVKKKSFWNGVH